MQSPIYSFYPRFGVILCALLGLALGGCPNPTASDSSNTSRTNTNTGGNQNSSNNNSSDNNNNGNNNGNSDDNGSDDGQSGDDDTDNSGDNGSGNGGDDNSGGGPPAVVPVIKAIPDQVVSFGANYRSPTPKLSAGTVPITWSLVTGPEGMTINVETGVATWSNANPVGTHKVQIRAANSAGFDDEEWTVRVEGSGIAPVVNEIPDVTINTGAPYIGAVPTLAQGTPPITWSLSAGPAGATINSATGVVTWNNPVVGAFTITIRASGPGGVDTEDWALTVQNPDGGAQAPLISDIPDNTVLEGTTYTGPTPALTQGTPPITWTLDTGPTGMTIDANTGVVTWTGPTIGQFSITIRAANAAGADTEEWKLTVEPAGNGQSPVIAEIPDATATEGAAYTGPTPALLQGAAPITWSLDEGPLGLTIDAGTGVVSWPLATLGQAVITIRATNAAGFDTESWTLTVESLGGGQVVWRVNVASDGAEARGGLSQFAAVSANGQFIAFESAANNLAANDANGVSDIFVYDQLSRQTTRVSAGPGGQDANGASRKPAISADGRYVAFESDASNLAGIDTGGVTNIFLHDRQTGQTELISVASGGGAAGNNISQAATISTDGRYVAFESIATNLVERDANNDVRDIFIRDRQTSQTRLASVSTGGDQGGLPSYAPSISGDGRYVAFTSFAQLVANDQGDQSDIFVRDLQDNTTTIVSVSGGGAQGNGLSQNARIDVSGRYVVFESAATNLVATPDFNNNFDVFRHDRQTGATVLISIESNGTRTANKFSGGPAITADGRFVAFYSDASDLVDPDDTPTTRDVFVRDMQTGATTLLSTNAQGVQGDLPSQYPTITADGRFIVFESRARNLVANDGNNLSDIFVRDRTK